MDISDGDIGFLFFFYVETINLVVHQTTAHLLSCFTFDGSNFWRGGVFGGNRSSDQENYTLLEYIPISSVKK
jgi:hypothetical protein